MSSIQPTYNERSWAIDVISHVKGFVRNGARSIKDAGGEQTIRADGDALFPDVLLFGDRTTARILQGWELKMPDTDIGDVEFRQNAETKARALGLDSFLLWNVSYARLYARNPESDRYAIENTWSDLSDVTSRTSVAPNRDRWQALAEKIIGYLNDLFDRGVLEGRQFVEAYRSGGITALIMQNADLVAEALDNAANGDVELRSAMTLWWARYRAEYTGKSMQAVLGQAVITNWIGKILFAHVLREQDSRAGTVEQIEEETSPEEALGLFREMSRDCDFWTIFSDSVVGLSVLPPKPWRELKQFNRLLSDLRVGSIDQTQLSQILEATAEVARRKLRGQYPTPLALARLLVNLAVRDIASDRLLDPCCGSGTIARAAIEQKLAVGVPAAHASGRVFAGDRDPQAAQIATFAIARPVLMNWPLRVFERDVFSLTPTTEIEFRNPSDGTQFREILGTFDAICSNLPFVAQSGRAQYGNAIREVTKLLSQGDRRFSGRADVSAYLPFSLHPLLANQGRMAIIITNAWLGTDWGDLFYDSLDRFYDLKCVITSGAGRWFRTSEVVTNILLLEKKNGPDDASGDIKFVVLKRPLEELEDEESSRIAAAQIELGQTQFETMSIRAVSPTRLSEFHTYGLRGNAQFVNCDWVLDLPLSRLSDQFSVSRGERRGLNALFYPREGHGVEADYIRPLAKGPADFAGVVGSASREAFSCSRSEDELRTLGHVGALNWINHFKTAENVQKLKRSGMRWYEMKADSLTELVMFINYGDRLFVGRLVPAAFVDQRMVRLIPRQDGVDMGLCHALMNSSIGLFLLEGLGFGRGLGALDLNKDRLGAYMHMLDPSAVDGRGRDSIISAFAPLAARTLLPVADELEQQDRQDFDRVVLAEFGLDLCLERVYESLLGLVEIRRTVLD